MTLPPDRIAALAEDLLSARDSGRQRPPLSDTEDAFGWDDAHAIAARIRTLRIASGETPVGRKIGFTNRTLWPRYSVNGPIWGDMFDRSVIQLDAAQATVYLPRVPEPRIEPEIVFGFGATPASGMSDAELLDCIEWVAHGFEIVTSVYPGWTFAAADCQAAFGLHGALLVGPRQPLARMGDAPAETLAALELTLTGGEVRAEGRGTDVLGGPLQALRFLLDGLDKTPGETPLKAGDIVTTGTLTDAMPVAPGDRWQTELRGCDLPGLDVTFR